MNNIEEVKDSKEEDKESKEDTKIEDKNEE